MPVDSTVLTRKGECSKCGDCCLAPWPKAWPESLRTWKKKDVEEMFPQAKLIPLPTHGGHTSGSVTVLGGEYPYTWENGRLERVLPDGSHNTECPFLLGQPGDEARNCALHGTKFHYMWEAACQPMPKEYMSEFRVEKWFQNNPNCSFEYVEE